MYFNTHAMGGTMSPIDMYVRILSLRWLDLEPGPRGLIDLGEVMKMGTFIKSDKVTEKTFQAKSPS